MNSFPVAMLGPIEILLIFVVFAVLATVAVAVAVWIIHEIRRAGRRPPNPGMGGIPGTPGTPAAWGSVGAGAGAGAAPAPASTSALAPAVLVGSGSVPAGTAGCPRCGRSLAEGSASGLCPKCLLEVGIGTQPAPEGSAAGGPAPDPAELAKRFPQFEIFEPIGQGGMGYVYRARQRKLDRVVALKVLPPAAGRDPAFAERFHREARALARMSHPNIVGVHEFGEAEGYFFLAMEYVDGADLRRVLQQGRLSPAEALRIVPVICDALQYAHANGVVHRDIKPGNILLDREGRVKIVDFGIAKLAGAPSEGADITLTQSRQSMGTPHYMAPEQVENPQSVDHRADIYSLGVVFYEMLTGELPLGRFQPPSRRVQVDVRFDEVVLRALEKEPDRRYQQAAEVRTEVQRIAAAGGGTETGSGFGPGIPGAGGSVPPGAVGSGGEERIGGWVGGFLTGRGPWPGDGLPYWVKPIAALGLTLLLPITLLAWRGAHRDGGLGGTPILPVLLMLGTVGIMAPFLVTLLGMLSVRDVVRGGGTRRRLGWSMAAAAFFPSLTVLFAVFYLGLAVIIGVLRLTPNEVLLAALVLLSLVAGGGAVFGLRRWIFARLDTARGGGPGGRPLGMRLTLLLPLSVLLVEFLIGALLLPFFLEDVSRRRATAWVGAPAVQPARVDPATGQLVWDPPLAWAGDAPLLAPWVNETSLPGLDLAGRGAIDRALGNAWRQYGEALRRHRTWSTNAAGRTVLEVRAFPGELDAIENAFWTAVDAELGRDGQRALRRLLATGLRGRWPSGPVATPRGSDQFAGYVPLVSGLGSMNPPWFWAGEEDLTLEYWRVGSWYRWRLIRKDTGVDSESAGGEAGAASEARPDDGTDRRTPGGDRFQEGTELPEALKRLVDLAAEPPRE